MTFKKALDKNDRLSPFSTSRSMDGSLATDVILGQLDRAATPICMTHNHPSEIKLKKAVGRSTLDVGQPGDQFDAPQYLCPN